MRPSMGGWTPAERGLGQSFLAGHGRICTDNLKLRVLALKLIELRVCNTVPGKLDCQKTKAPNPLRSLHTKYMPQVFTET